MGKPSRIRRVRPPMRPVTGNWPPVFIRWLALATAMSGKPAIKESRILVVSSGVHEVTGGETLSPDRATLLAPCKTIPQEYPHIGCHSVDMLCLNPGPSAVEQQVRQIMAELEWRSLEPVAAYRGKHRWVQRYEPVKLLAPASIIPLLREGGSTYHRRFGKYRFADRRFLARRLKARLVLSGRTPIPERSGGMTC